MTSSTTQPRIAPYGEWASPIDVELLTGAVVGLSDPRVDGDDLYWLESRPDQGGRASLWCRRTGAEPVELTPEHYVRTSVHEYGGGAYAVSGGSVIFSTFPDGAIQVLEPGGEPRLLPTPENVRYAAFELHPQRRLAIAVAEDHNAPGEARARVVALRLDSQDAAQTEVSLVSGADFYDNPSLSEDGRLAWVEWDHPNMPWDLTRLRVAELSQTGSRGPTLGEARTVAEGCSTMQPTWQPTAADRPQRLVFLSDRSGFWNLHAWDPATGDSTCLHQQDAEFGSPAWQLGGHDFAVLDPDRIVVRWLDEGIARLGILTHTGITPIELTAPNRPNTISQLSGAGDLVVCNAGFADQPPAILALDLSPATQETATQETATQEQVRRSAHLELDPAVLSTPRPISFGDPAAHAWYFPPTNPDFTAPEGELPPLRVLSHGGPTGFATPALSLEVQFWTSRGFAVVDVNYGGSAGYGREFRERLKGQWGIVDVADCVAAAQYLVDHGLADPRRIWIEGGSAGGYTTLRALTDTDFFAAGISLYGVGDLGALARDTHKFESRYLDGLVGPWPEAKAVYAERSPVEHLDQLSTPMLILQGDQDKVVPPAQAEQMAAAVRAKGLPVALVMFAGEGHGFRRADSIRRTLEASQSFLGQVFGFTPADRIEPLEIENLQAQ